MAVLGPGRRYVDCGTWVPARGWASYDAGKGGSFTLQQCRHCMQVACKSHGSVGHNIMEA